MTTYYKFLNDDGSACHGGLGKWNLPMGEKPGKWMPKLDDEKLSPCEYGYHLCRRQDVLGWLAPAMFIAEAKGRIVTAGDKVVVGQARLVARLIAWNDRTARLFAADCAEKAVNDAPEEKDRAVFLSAIQTARLFAEGQCSKQDLSAAWNTALNAAGSAALNAAGSWQTDRLFHYIEVGQ